MIEHMFEMIEAEDRPEAVVAAGLESLSAESPGELRSVVLADQVVELAGLIDRLHIEWLRRVGELDKRNLYRVEGAVSAAAWIRWRCRREGGEARRAVATARDLAEMPLTEAAAVARKITPAQIEVLAGAHRRHPEAFVISEEILVEAARRCTTPDVRRLVGYWSQNLDPDRTVRDAETVREQRRLHLSMSTDGGFLDGFFDPEGAVTVDAALVAHTQAGDRDAEDTRTPAQRRADALVDICRRVLDTGTLPTVNGEKPHLSVIVDLETLQGRPSSWSQLAATGHLLSPDVVGRISCDAQVTRIVLDPAGQPIDVGRATRTVTTAQRKALMVRDQTCRFPGCDRPQAWCDAHHVRQWAKGGTGDMDNLLLLCRHHHTLIHQHGYTISGDAIRPRFHRPDRTPLDFDPP